MTTKKKTTEEELEAAKLNKQKASADYSDYADRGYQQSSTVQQAQVQKQQAQQNLSSLGDFNYSKQTEYDKVIDSILNQKPFQYDLNGDMLYQQYKDQYTSLGKTAMQDTMGQAAMLTGGYSNSYANTAGAQAYQSYLGQLNDVIPSLYQLALDRYNAEQDALKDRYNVLSDDMATQYGLYSDQYNRLLTERDYASGEYDNAYARDYGEWQDRGALLEGKYNLYGDAYSDALNAEEMEYNRALTAEQVAYERAMAERELAYQQERDAVSDAQWQEEFDEDVRRYNAETSVAEEAKEAETWKEKLNDSKTMARAKELLENEEYKVSGSANYVAYNYLYTLVLNNSLTEEEADYIADELGIEEDLLSGSIAAEKKYGFTPYSNATNGN